MYTPTGFMCARALDVSACEVHAEDDLFVYVRVPECVCALCVYRCSCVNRMSQCMQIKSVLLSVLVFVCICMCACARTCTVARGTS